MQPPLLSHEGLLSKSLFVTGIDLILIVCSAIVNAAQNPQAAWPNPVLQCLQIREMKAGPQGGPTRYRIVLSDIDHFSQGMLATRMAPPSDLTM